MFGEKVDIKIDENELSLKEIFKRFIEKVESREISKEKVLEEKVISINDFRKNFENNVKHNYINHIDLVVSDATFDIIDSKIRILTLIDINDPDSEYYLDFEQKIELFKEALRSCEERYENFYEENINSIHNTIDILTNKAVELFLKKYYKPINNHLKQIE